MPSGTGEAAEPVDICVVGGSIAGATAAIVLRSFGLSIAIIEREPRFRDKARGEGIHPWGMDEAEDIGIRGLLEAAGANPLPVWKTYNEREPQEPFYWADQSARGNVEHGVFHPRLQDGLLAAAVESGARLLRPATLVALGSNGDAHRVIVNCAGEVAALHAKVVIAADGTRSKARSAIGVNSHRDRQHHWFAGVLINHYRGDESAAHAGLLAGGRFFILPQGGGKARLYAGLMPDRIAPVRADRTGRALIDIVSSQLPPDLLAGTIPAGPHGVFSNADVWPELVTRDGVVLIGDAAGTNDPTIGHGISLTFRDVRELRDAIAAHGLVQIALDQYASRRQAYYGTLRTYAKWMAELWIEGGQVADNRRQRFRAARASDPDAGGFNFITALGPRDLVADQAARARFFGGSTGSELG